MLKILVIEDDEVTAHIYRRRLQKEGYEVEVCPDGQAGFFRIHEVKPAAILLDLMLPHINGIQILRKIRAQPQFRSMPVLVFTNAYVPNMVDEAMRAGATCVFNKSTLKPQELLDRLRQELFPSLAQASAPPSSVAQEEKKGASAIDNGETEIIEAEPHVDIVPAVKPPPLVSLPTPGNRAVAHQGDTSNAVEDTDRPPPLRLVHSAPGPQPATQSRVAQPPDVPAGKIPGQSAPLPYATASDNDDQDSEFRQELLATFKQAVPEIIQEFAGLTQRLLQANHDPDRLAAIEPLYRQVHRLAGSAGLAGLPHIAQMASGLEALLKAAQAKPREVGPWTWRSVATACDTLRDLMQHLDLGLDRLPLPRILIIDDDPISRRAMAHAVSKTGIEAMSCDDPKAALELAAQQAFELVLVDVEMPGLDGFQFAQKLRAIPEYGGVPIIFVTSLQEFQTRAQASLSGGNDFVPKPFLFAELGVKALTWIFRSRLQKARRASREAA